MIGWLRRHRRTTILLMAGYFVFVVLGHDLMQQPALWANRKVGDKRWNVIIAAAAVLAALIACGWLIGRLRRHARLGVALFYLAATGVFAAVSFFTLLQVNIEIIHFPQYLILAMLLFALTGSFVDTMILGTIGGVIDEGFQYFYLHANWGVYLDLNDIVLNTIGMGMGLISLFIIEVQPARRNWGSRIVIGGILLVAATIALTTAGVISTARIEAKNSRVIALTRCSPTVHAWHTTGWGKRYYVLTPEWGFGITGALVVFYSLLNAFRSRSKSMLTPLADATGTVETVLLQASK